MVVAIAIIAGVIAFLLLYKLGAVRPPTPRLASRLGRSRSRAPWRDAMKALEGNRSETEDTGRRSGDEKSTEAFEAQVGDESILVTRSETGIVIESTSSHPEQLQIRVDRRDDILFQPPGETSRTETGHGAFDRHFELRTNNLDLALVWLTRYVRQRLLVAMSFDVRLEPDAVIAERRSDDPFDAEEIVEAGKAVARLAGRGRAVTRRWREIAQAVGGSLASSNASWKPGGSSTILVDDRGTKILLEVMSRTDEDGNRGDCLRTMVSAKLLQSDDERFVLYRDTAPKGTRRLTRVRDFDAELDGEHKLRASKAAKKLTRLNRRRCRVLRELDPLRVVGDGTQVVLELEGLVLDEERLRLAVETVGNLAAPVAAGPYR